MLVVLDSASAQAHTTWEAISTVFEKHAQAMTEQFESLWKTR